MTANYREQLQQHRERKQTQFATADNSPIPPADRGDAFPGLDFFDPDPDYRFVLPLQEYDDPETIRVGTTTDGEQTYRRWGEFAFTVDGEDCRLQAYRSDPDTARLWVPFRDETSGTETYGAGRYLDLEPDHHLTDDGWVLDFNLAYNPTCAYNEAYECPLIPTENWLDVPIEAGEKDYPGDPASVTTSTPQRQSTGDE